MPVGNGRYDAYLLPDNLGNLPFLIWDTPGDGHYKANHAFADELRQRAEKFPGFYPNLELTDPKGGHGIIDRKLQDEGWAWMTSRSATAIPSWSIYKTHWLRYDGAYWARIDTVEDPQPAGTHRGRRSATDACRVAVENADRFHLDLVSAAGRRRQGAVDVRINGARGDQGAGREGRLLLEDGKDEWSVAAERYPPDADQEARRLRPDSRRLHGASGADGAWHDGRAATQPPSRRCWTTSSIG